jgi:SAM-dependent methyltransferase
MGVRQDGIGWFGKRKKRNATISPAAALGVRELFAARDESPGFWGTLDPETVSTFEDLFYEVDGCEKTILEIGSGYGFTCVLLALLGAAEVHGVEVIQPVVQAAVTLVRRMGGHLPVFFRQADVSRGLPYADARFDVVLMIEVLSHVVVSDLGSFIREIVRVVKPGGYVIVSDGNNARSWKRRRENYRLWERFDQGPPTTGSDTVFSHKIAVPYIALRREIAEKTAPSLSSEEANTIAAQTFGFNAAEVEAAARRFVETGERPQSPFRRGVCPIEPIHRMYIEQLIDPLEVRRYLRATGCEEVVCGPRRVLPFGRLWTVAPRLTFLLTNGFKITARKRRR